MDDPLRLENVVVEGATLVWGDPYEVTFIGKSSFRDCAITVTCAARGMVLMDTAFLNCVVTVKKPFANHQFFDITFEGCTFHGRFPGCEFGYRPLYESQLRGYVKHCDFSDTTLDAVAINSSDPSTLRFPAWPHFVVVSPAIFPEVSVLTQDPTWRILRDLPWSPETTAVVLRYRTTGKNAFSVPAALALSELRRHPQVQVRLAV